MQTSNLAWSATKGQCAGCQKERIWLKTYSFWPVLITIRVEMAGQFWLTGCTHTSTRTCSKLHIWQTRHVRMFTVFLFVSSVCNICTRRQRMKAEVKCQDLGTPEANASWHTFWDRYVEVIEALWTSWSPKLDGKNLCRMSANGWYIYI